MTTDDVTEQPTVVPFVVPLHLKFSAVSYRRMISLLEYYHFSKPAELLRAGWMFVEYIQTKGVTKIYLLKKGVLINTGTFKGQITALPANTHELEEKGESGEPLIIRVAVPRFSLNRLKGVWKKMGYDGIADYTADSLTLLWWIACSQADQLTLEFADGTTETSAWPKRKGSSKTILTRYVLVWAATLVFASIVSLLSHRTDDLWIVLLSCTSGFALSEIWTNRVKIKAFFVNSKTSKHD